MKYPTNKQWIAVIVVYVVLTLWLTGIGRSVAHFMTSNMRATVTMTDSDGEPQTYNTGISLANRLRLANYIQPSMLTAALALLFLLSTYRMIQIKARPVIAIPLGLLLFLPAPIFVSLQSEPSIDALSSGSCKAPGYAGLLEEGTTTVQISPTFAQRLNPNYNNDPIIKKQFAYLSAKEFLKSRLPDSSTTIEERKGWINYVLGDKRYFCVDQPILKANGDTEPLAVHLRRDGDRFTLVAITTPNSFRKYWDKTDQQIESFLRAESIMP